MSSKEIKKILIIKPSALGDIALALPALSSLRQSFPDAKITWLVRKEFSPLLELADSLDDVILFDRKFLGKWYKNPKAFAELMRFFKALSSPKFDLVIDFQGLFRTALFSRITGSKKRFGIKGSREFADFFYTHKIQPDDNSIHLIDLHNKILSAAGAQKISYDYGLSVDDETMHKAEAILNDRLPESKKYAVFVTGAAHKRKCWPVEHFADLANRLHDQYGLSVVAVGTDIDKPSIEQLSNITNLDIIDVAGITSIKVLTAIMSKAALVVSNDTGPGHIAVAVGAPVTMMFGPTNPARIFPYNKPQSVVALDTFTRGSEIASTAPKYAIENVTVDAVFAKASSILDGQQ